MAAKSYYHRPSPTRRCLYTTLIEVFDKQCLHEPKKEAFIFYDETLRRSSVTFQEAYDRSLSLAAGLLKTYPELRPGARICIYIESKWEYVLSVLALLRLRVTAALANIDDLDDKKLLKVIEQTGCCGLITDVSRLQESGLGDALAKRKGWIFTISDEKNQSLSDGVLSIENLSEVGCECGETRTKILTQQKMIDPGTDAVIFFTSGSTGPPKAILYSHFAFLNAEYFLFSDVLGYTSEDVQLHDKPVSYSLGFELCFQIPVYFGGSSVTVSNKLNTSSAKSHGYLSLIEREKATATVLFGTVIYDLVHESTPSHLNLSSLRLVIIAGQTLSEEHVQKLLMRFSHVRLTHLYGLTEGFIACNTKGKELVWMKIISDLEVKVVDENDQLVPLNSPGEICVRSDFMMSGYVTDGKVHAGRDHHGWFHTGDKGIMNKSGELFIIGRMSDIITRGSSRIQVLPLEELLDSHPKVKKSAIVPVPDPDLGSDLCACIIPSECPVAETEVLDWCSVKFGNDSNGVNLRPKCCIFMEEFPLTISGKISKPKLKLMVKEYLKI